MRIVTLKIEVHVEDALTDDEYQKISDRVLDYMPAALQDIHELLETHGIPVTKIKGDF